jgi:hypothetical protein
MMRILKDMTFNEAEIAIFMNVRSLSEKTTTLITSTKITEIIEIIENAPDISDTDIAGRIRAYSQIYTTQESNLQSNEN